MKELVYKVSFNTPAFLGNAEQQAQWRTPPFKALIRQWWRVVKAPELGYSVVKLRVAEGELFGYASDSGNDGERVRNKTRQQSLQSRVRLRMANWIEGSLDDDNWPRPEIKGIPVGQGRSIPADVYLGFGPILPANRKENRPPGPGRSAIDPGSAANQLRIGFTPDVKDEHVAEVRAAMGLVSWFGSIGSRARNGWGSVHLNGDNLAPLPNSTDTLAQCLRPLERCFELDWPHAIGTDGVGPLVWVGRPLRNWREAVFHLATTRRAIRAAAKKFGHGRDISANQLVAYPVTQSSNSKWANDERIASSLRLKVVKTDDGLVPVAVHLPCAVPRRLFEMLTSDDQLWVTEKQVDIWHSAHLALDVCMERIGGAQ